MKTTTYKGHDLGRDFKSYARKCRKAFQIAFNDLGGELTDFSIGFYYFSGFGIVNGQYYYFSISDVRHFPDSKILFRTAKSNKDYSGGTNQYLSKSMPLTGQMKNIIEKRVIFCSL